MFASSVVREHDASLGALLRDFVPGDVPLPDALPMWEAFDQIERRAAIAKMLLTARVDESRAAQRSGHRDTAELLAKKGGTSTGTARRRLDTAKKLRNLPTTEEALRNGELSADQADVIAGAAAVNPEAEQRLLHHAQRSSFAELRDEALRARAQGEDRDATERRIQQLGASAPGPMPKAPGTSRLVAPRSTGPGSWARSNRSSTISSPRRVLRTDGRNARPARSTR